LQPRGANKSLYPLLTKHRMCADGVCSPAAPCSQPGDVCCDGGVCNGQYLQCDENEGSMFCVFPSNCQGRAGSGCAAKNERTHARISVPCCSCPTLCYFSLKCPQIQGLSSLFCRWDVFEMWPGRDTLLQRLRRLILLRLQHGLQWRYALLSDATECRP
jgi:hypothetical protein